MFADMPDVSMVLGNEEKLQPQSWLPGANDRVRVNEIMSPRKNHLHMIDGLTERTRAFVQVQNRLRSSLHVLHHSIWPRQFALGGNCGSGGASAQAGGQWLCGSGALGR
jgi:hypothetical protein